MKRDYPRIVVPPPSPKAKAIVERQNRWSSTSYPKEYPLAIARGERAMVEDVDGAIKLARHSTGRPAIVAFTGAFHGRTYGGLSLTASKSIQRAGFAPFLPEVYHVPYGYRYHCEFCRGEPACTMRCVSSIEDDLFAKRLDPKSVAAVFVEPIQGEGGYVVPPPGYLQALRDLCDRHGILLVCDEVQCGVGRTGTMWACEQEGIEPDVLLAAKGLGSGMPIGAIIARE